MSTILFVILSSALLNLHCNTNGQPSALYFIYTL